MIRCLIVDDEEPAKELVRLHLANQEGFEVVASLTNAFEAFSYMQKSPVDLAFIDINMPRLSGLELLRSLKLSPKVILTTAYREFAADAFELNVFDYLVKPITKERFMKAASRFLHYWNTQSESSELLKPDPEAYSYFKTGRDQVKIFLNDILWVEGLADYVKVNTITKSYIVSDKLGLMEDKLPSTSFLRIHKSYIVHLDKITCYNVEQVMLKDKTLPLGRLFKAGFFENDPDE